MGFWHRILIGWSASSLTARFDVLTLTCIAIVAGMHLLIENSAAHVGSSIGSADREAQNFTLVVAFKSNSTNSLIKKKKKKLRYWIELGSRTARPNLCNQSLLSQLWNSGTTFIIFNSDDTKRWKQKRPKHDEAQMAKCTASRIMQPGSPSLVSWSYAFWDYRLHGSHGRCLIFNSSPRSTLGSYQFLFLRRRNTLPAISTPAAMTIATTGQKKRSKTHLVLSPIRKMVSPGLLDPTHLLKSSSPNQKWPGIL